MPLERIRRVNRGPALSRFYLLLTAAAALFVSGLYLPVAAEPIRARIIDGTPLNETAYPNVARLSVDGELLCTGTLVSSRHILTAAHCFYDDRNRRGVGDTDVVVRMAGQQYGSSKVYIHPTYRPRSSACVEGETDAAIIELDSDVVGITPSLLLDSAVPLGATVTLAGYGTLGNGADGENGSIPPVGTIYAGTTVIEGYGENPPQQNAASSYVYWLFDSNESNTASGDSGGPAFYTIGADAYLAAITCGGGGNAEIGSYSFDTRVDLIAGWVRSITGTTPPNTPPAFSASGPQSASTGKAFSYRVPVIGSAPLQLVASTLPAGLSLSGATISGTPTVKGTTTVTLTASNAFGSATTDVVIVVSGFEPTLSMKKVLLQFDNAKNSDFLDISGKIGVGSKFNPRNKKITITVGRFSKSFRLTSNGQSAGSGRSYFDLIGAFRGSVFRNSTVGFALSFERVALFNELTTLGFADSENATDGQQVPLPVTVSINGIEASSTVILSFHARDSRWRISK